MTDREAERQRRREDRLAQEEAEQRAARRRRRLKLAGAAAALIAVAVVVVVVLSSGQEKPRATARNPALLASTAGQATGRAVNGIQCQTTEQVVFHIHAHLAVFVDGRQRLVPEGIGIVPPRTEQRAPAGPFVVGGSCLYWLHSHTRDGVIHIESPLQRSYTLGNYFAIWGQPLGPQQVGPAHGAVTAYLNGRRVLGNPAAIPLKPHAVIQLDVGSPMVSPVPFTFPAGL
jgi:hypothetical protein